MMCPLAQLLSRQISHPAWELISINPTSRQRIEQRAPKLYGSVYIQVLWIENFILIWY